MFYLVLLPLFLLYIGGLVLLWHRNSRTLSFRLELLDKVSNAAKSDIQVGRAWEWHYAELQAVSYLKMVFVCWKPLIGFYPNDPTREIE